MNDMEIPQDEALAVGLGIQGVRHCLSICGLMTPAIQDAVIAEGFVELVLFAELHDKDIHEMVKSINTNPIPPPFQVQRAPSESFGQIRDQKNKLPAFFWKFSPKSCPSKTSHVSTVCTIKSAPIIKLSPTLVHFFAPMIFILRHSATKHGFTFFSFDKLKKLQPMFSTMAD
jgi:hypothetical protein